MKKIWTYVKSNRYYIELAIIFSIIGYYIGQNTGKNTKITNVTSPVEESRIDTLYVTRDSLIYVTKYLDSVKYDTIQKVYSLNDTATLQLFLQLVSE